MGKLLWTIIIVLLVLIGLAYFFIPKYYFASSEEQCAKWYPYVGELGESNLNNFNNYNKCIEKVGSSIGAINNKDITCDTGQTKGYCYSQTAIEKNNPNICDSLEISERDVCYKFYADAKNDVTICRDKISNENVKESCYSSLDESESVCGEIKNLGYSSADNCYKSLAIKSYDDSICNQISTQEKIDECIRLVHLND